MEAHKIEECLVIYQDLKAENKKLIEQGVHDYSLINALLKANDEVRLHSRFIFSMINPDGLHYCGNQFLKIFLDLLPEKLKSFIDPENAKVFKEKGSIDLLIHDDNNFLIVENKLNAVDQKYQITRYIQYIQKKFFENREDISSNIAVIYLSKSKKAPSQESESLIGFRPPEGGTLHWEGSPVMLGPLLSFNLTPGAKIPFVHLPYFPKLQKWVSDCAEIAPAGGRKNAFEEYQIILERLNTNKPWRKVLSLDQYALNLPEDEQKKIYELMVESRKMLVSFVSTKLHTELIKLFDEETINEHGEYKHLTVESIKKWLLQKGKKDDWKDIGFSVTGREGNQRIGFVLAELYAYFGIYDEASSIVRNKSQNQILGGNTRKSHLRELLLNDPEGIYKFINEIKKKKFALGLQITDNQDIVITANNA
ncbi:PD-(D/E)XK nuclease family protein [Methylobacter sp. S3L5C]|uniref:PDDEXK-like family protein n=1 Tax=Methylobacter sp. S3L5C TaxID=2839024 RepID=UPI001FAE636D|nr:PD-(D/E)XK nuclease family protein [Methylobacter sp. S3L5C]UOA10326.1 PD-(D/E)XK nuclease family protein [Methylobacter sp. S3L5C]